MRNQKLTIPQKPKPTVPKRNWKHYKLWKAVKKAIYTMPARFESELVISGVLATDLFAFNSSLSATIEEQVVASLNELRSDWDPEQKYSLYSFERQPQTFPDVVLRTSVPNITPKIIMGIELKGWYALAKEGEPSFRYKVTPAVCAPADLLVVVPWALSQVISGSPQVFAPYVISARQAAEYRNWYWEYARGGQSKNRGVEMSAAINQYPKKSDPISDQPESDSGSNFGRIARSGVMEDYVKERFDDTLAGIPLWAWQKFLLLFTEEQTTEKIQVGLDKLKARVGTIPKDRRSNMAVILREVAEIMTGD